MKIAGIMEITEIVEILRDSLSDWELSGIELIISMKMRVPGTVYLLDDSNSMVAILEPLGSNSKAQVHVYSKNSRTKAESAFSFIKKVCNWIVDNTTYQCFVGFTPTDNLPARILARLVGFKKIGMIPLDSGATEQITMVTREQWLSNILEEE